MSSKSRNDLLARFDRDDYIKAGVDRLLEFVDEPEDREAIRRIGQRAICQEGPD